MELSKSQLDVYESVKRFINSDDRCLIIQGISGTGKSALINQLYEEGIDGYRINLTASTNKAANQLNPSAITIHKLTSSKVVDNFSNGSSNLTSNIDINTFINAGKLLIVVDECSMLSKDILEVIQYIVFNTKDVKILFVGDKNQLPPVNEVISGVYTKNIKEVELTEIQRGKNFESILKINKDCLKFVQTEVDKLEVDINNENVTMSVLDVNLRKKLYDLFSCEYTNKSVVLSYTNSSVEFYNYLIRDILNKPLEIVEGDTVINNTPFTVKNIGLISTGSELEIVNIKDAENDFEIIDYLRKMKNEFIDERTLLILKNVFKEFKIEFKKVIFNEYSNEGCITYIPKNKNNYMMFLNDLKRNKKWYVYFFLTKVIPELRFNYALTVHKAQGSSYQNVFIDLNDFNKCRDKKDKKKLTYVALTRSLENICFIGDYKTENNTLTIR